MSALTKEGHQIILKDGQPEFVVVPYGDYRGLVGIGTSQLIPHEIVDLHITQGHNIIKAWRVYLKKTQKDVAEKMGITQPAYAQIEKSENPREATLLQAALAMDLDPLCMDIE